jgi:hypothetical protein
MEDVDLPDVNKVRGSSDERKLPPQTSAEDTSNWDDRAIALPDPKRGETVFILNDSEESVAIDVSMTVNPYLEQERLTSDKGKK